MTTKLEKEIRREISIDGEPYTVAISPAGIKLTIKGRRNGHELTWKDIVSGQRSVTQDRTALNERQDEEVLDEATE